jgi:gamma-glutamyltranspeptidase/glutathione hydrolase
VRAVRAIVLTLSLVSIWPIADAAAQQTTATGTGGAVVTESPVATGAAVGVLRHGGNAVDAAVAAASTLGVSDPLVAGIGGGGYFVYYDAHTHRVSTIDGREMAPAADGPDLFIDPITGEPLDFPTAVTSGLSVGVPGNLMTWAVALRRWGKHSLASDLQPAERTASSGYKLDSAVREEIRENAFRFKQFSSSNALFLPGGKVPTVGTTMKDPDLAATYREIGRDGVGALYGGPIGEDVVGAIHALPLARGATLVPRPGEMSLSDLTAYRAPVKAPTHVNYRGLDVYSMGPSSSGGSTVGESLNILGNFNLSHQTRTQALYHYLEATRLAFADRNRYVGDSAFVKVPLRQLLSKGFARTRACLINPRHALKSPVAPGDPFKEQANCTPKATTAAQPREGTNTNELVVADKQGDVVSYTNTIEELGGSGIVVPGRGFLLNNELTDFDFAPLQKGVPDPNLPAAGKRPRSSMSPTIVLKNRKPFLALGAAGGSTIITSVVQILMNRVDLRMTLPQAMAAPRASQRNSDPTQAEPAFLKLATTAGLEKLGEKFDIDDTSPLDPKIKIAPTIGWAAALELLGGGRMQAVGEPKSRNGGGAAGVAK